MKKKATRSQTKVKRRKKASSTRSWLGSSRAWQRFWDHYIPG